MASSRNYPAQRVGKTAMSGSIESQTGEPAIEFVRYRALVSRVVDAFGDEIKASRWLSIPSPDLGGETPLQAVQSSGYDMKILEPILTRIEHGIDY
jgi:uncharacterized protein (DUF2384 family)